MFNDLDWMSPEDRLHAVAAILAAGFLRWKSRSGLPADPVAPTWPLSEKVQKSPATRLELSRKPWLSVPHVSGQERSERT